MVAAVTQEEAAQTLLLGAINAEYQKMTQLMTAAQLNTDSILSVLTTQKQLLEQERQEKARKIEDLEAEDASNKAERKAWEEE